MSLGEEILEEIEIDYAALQIQIESDAKRGVWTTRDGLKIPVTEMTSEHIKNTIVMLERNDAYDLYLPWINRLQHELDERSKAERYERIHDCAEER